MTVEMNCCVRLELAAHQLVGPSFARTDELDLSGQAEGFVLALAANWLVMCSIRDSISAIASAWNLSKSASWDALQSAIVSTSFWE